MTGLPFVFAAWVSNIDLPENFKTEFNKASAFGLDNLNEVISSVQYDIYDMQTYYSKNVSYRLDKLKEEGLQLFLKYISNSVA